MIERNSFALSIYSVYLFYTIITFIIIALVIFDFVLLLLCYHYYHYYYCYYYCYYYYHYHYHHFYITHLSLPKNKTGLSIKILTHAHIRCKVSVQRTLKSSLKKHVRNMYQLTSNKNVNTDYLLSQLTQLKNISSRKKTKTLLSMKINEFIWNKFLDLKEQCGIIKFLVNLITPSKILEQLVTPSLPNHIVNIPRHYIIFSLSNGTNLQR